MNMRIDRSCVLLTPILGVNLPAGRVVIKAQVRGPIAINATTYRQMSGRAGRLGQVEIGIC